jgi:hypothetical protein
VGAAGPRGGGGDRTATPGARARSRRPRVHDQGAAAARGRGRGSSCATSLSARSAPLGSRTSAGCTRSGGTGRPSGRTTQRSTSRGPRTRKTRARSAARTPTQTRRPPSRSSAAGRASFAAATGRRNYREAAGQSRATGSLARPPTALWRASRRADGGNLGGRESRSHRRSVDFPAPGAPMSTRQGASASASNRARWAFASGPRSVSGSTRYPPSVRVSVPAGTQNRGRLTSRGAGGRRRRSGDGAVSHARDDQVYSPAPTFPPRYPPPPARPQRAVGTTTRVPTTGTTRP